MPHQTTPLLHRKEWSAHKTECFAHAHYDIVFITSIRLWCAHDDAFSLLRKSTSHFASMLFSLAHAYAQRYVPILKL